MAKRTANKKPTKKAAKKPAKKPVKKAAKKSTKKSTKVPAKKATKARRVSGGARKAKSPSKAKKPAGKAKKRGAKPNPAAKKSKSAVIKQADKKAATASSRRASGKAARTESQKIHPLEALFGTDGIRSHAGSGALTPEHILAIGRALGRYLTEQTKGEARPKVLLGVDPRPSADMVGTALAAGLIAECCDVHWPGMMSTPEVAFLTGHGPFAAGVSITASHNPATDNGIKIFGKDGRKLPEAIEKRLELAVLSGKTIGAAKGKANRFGWLELGRDRHYENYILKTFRKSFASLKKRAIAAVVDAAYGARSVDLQVLSSLAHSLAFGKTTPEYRVGSSMQAGGEAVGNALDIYFMNAASPSTPDSHALINKGCGSMHPDGCANAVR